MPRIQALALCTSLLSMPAAAVEFTVDTTSDALLQGCTAAAQDCSLRGALAAANGIGSVHDVRFAIPLTDPGCVPASGVCTIRAATSLPDINPNLNGLVTIDGYSQPGAVPNTLGPAQGGTNAQLKIVVSANAPSVPAALRFIRHGSVRGLVINGFRDNTGGGTAVSFSSFGAGGVVEGCFIGTDVSGSVAAPNGYGVIFEGNPFGGGFSNNGRIGGSQPAQRNLISGQAQEGILLDGSGHVVLGNLIGTNAAGTLALANQVGVRMNGGSGFVQTVGAATAAGRNLVSGNTFAGIVVGGAGPTNGHRIIGNFIGTDISGSLPLGNAGIGVRLEASTNGVQPPLVGGIAAGEGNTIAFNGTQGVATRSVRGQVIGNRFFGNGQLAISSSAGDNGSASGRRVNDAGDADEPANRGQNAPEITAFSINGAQVDLSYRIDTAIANAAYPLRVEFFRARADEGELLLGSDSYTAAQAQSAKAIVLGLPPASPLGAADVIVATATDADGNTSEFSFSPATITVLVPEPTPCTAADSVFCNGYESGPQRSLRARVRVTATAGVFAPNGTVNLSDDRGGSCVATLQPSVPTLTSEGECMLLQSGAPGTISINAVLGTFRSAFGTPSGGDLTASASFIVP